MSVAGPETLIEAMSAVGGAVVDGAAGELPQAQTTSAIATGQATRGVTG